MMHENARNLHIKILIGLFVRN